MALTVLTGISVHWRSYLLLAEAVDECGRRRHVARQPRNRRERIPLISILTGNELRTLYAALAHATAMKPARTASVRGSVPSVIRSPW
jgi:hypothetical protein